MRVMHRQEDKPSPELGSWYCQQNPPSCVGNLVLTLDYDNPLEPMDTLSKDTMEKSLSINDTLSGLFSLSFILIPEERTTSL